MFPIHSTSVKKLTGSSVIFLRNGVLILNGKENKEAGAICFESRVQRKKNKEIFCKVPSKIYESNFIMEKNKNIFWFVNISKYHHREMGLMMLVTCQRFGDLFLFGLVWQYSTNQNQYNKGRFKVMATYLQQ